MIDRTTCAWGSYVERGNFRVRLASCIAGLAMWLIAWAHADVLRVHPNGGGDYQTIQAAVDAATSGDIIELQDGLFRGVGNRDVEIRGTELTIRSASGDPDVCTIDCEGGAADPHRAFEFANVGLPYSGSVSGITIINGYADLGGAIVSRELAYASVIDCVFRDNVAGLGGALCCIAEEAINRDAGSGDYLYLISGCRFENNRALGSGGAACMLSGSYLFEDCDVRANEGGGIFFQFARMEMKRCRFYGNSGSLGALVWDTCFSPATLEKCIFSVNVPAALYSSHDVEAYLLGCTFWGNEIAIRDLGGTCFTIERTIIAHSTQAAFSDGDNALFACGDMYGNAGGDWVGDLADQLGLAGNISADPLFCDPNAESFYLQTQSPCAPFSPPNEECDLIGARPVNCSGTPVQPASWGQIKALFK